MMWGVDEDDGVLFSIADYTQIPSGPVAAGLTSYGKLKWNDGGTIRTIGDDMEAFTLDVDGTAYIALDDDLGGTHDQVLLSFNVNTASTTGDNIVTVLGRIAGGSTGNLSGLSIQPGTGALFALDRRSGTDRLLTISKVDGSLLSDLGRMSGLGESVCDGEDLEFDLAGNLYVTDNEDEELYRVDPLSAAIVSVVDGDQSDGLGDDLKIEALGWDPISNRLIGFADHGNDFLLLTLEDGNNASYGGFECLTDVEGVDFVPVVPEPATLSLLALGACLPLLRRRKRASPARRRL